MYQNLAGNLGHILAHNILREGDQKLGQKHSATTQEGRRYIQSWL